MTTRSTQRAPAKKSSVRKRKIQEIDYSEEAPHKPIIDNSPIEGKTENQQRYIKAIHSSILVFATGPAGVGKTWISTAYAAQQLVNKKIEKLIVTRPAVEAGESLGFLPGEIDEKFDPYLQPFRDVLNRRLGKGYTDYLIKAEQIEAVPLAYLRGRTFRNAVVILDEAQNTTPNQMKMFLTRIGEDCTVIVNGDPSQKDIVGACGLVDAISKVRSLPGVRVIEFTKADVVRSGLTQMIVERYEN